MNGVPVLWGWDDNETLIDPACPDDTVLVIEDIGHYGLAVGRDVFQTVKWMGRMQQAFKGETVYIPRGEVLINLCGKRQGANDSTVRQALIDRYGGDDVAIGGKKCQACKGKGWRGAGRPVCEECNGNKYETPQGVLYGVSGHAWSALAVGVTYLDQQSSK